MCIQAASDAHVSLSSSVLALALLENSRFNPCFSLIKMCYRLAVLLLSLSA